MKKTNYPADVGVRELKTHASEVIRRVAEEHATYVVSRRGKPVGLLTPVTMAMPPSNDGAVVWKRLESLGAELDRAWKVRKSSGALVSEMRR